MDDNDEDKNEEIEHQEKMEMVVWGGNEKMEHQEEGGNGGVEWKW